MANLPKFSGKYATAGAYERPQTVLDKSGFIYAKTLSDLGPVSYTHLTLPTICSV